MVKVESFCNQFGTEQSPTRKHVAQAWSRLLRDKRDLSRSIHRKPFVMAVLYMLHIETRLELSKREVDIEEREKLKRFAKWVPCQCRQHCGREWNFVNEIGLSRGGDNDVKCDFPRLMENKKHWTVTFKTDQVKRLKATRDVWLARV